MNFILKLEVKIMSNEETIKVTLEELKKLLKTNSIVGETIETENAELIPIVKMGFGFGTGGVNDAGFGGAGAGIDPVSMVVIPKGESGSENIRVIDITARSETNKAINDLASIVTGIIKSYAAEKQGAYEANWEYKQEEDVKPENNSADINDVE